MLDCFSFTIFVVLLISFDLWISKQQKSNFKTSFIWSCFWVLLGILFGLYVYFTSDINATIDYYTAYFIEKSLSVDNLFIFVIVFEFFNIPPKQQHKVLFYGILSAILMRCAFIFIGAEFVSKFHWVLYVFGIMLLLAGIKLIFTPKQHKIEDSRLLRQLNKRLPVFSEPANTFFIKQKGKLYVTNIFLALIFIEISDLIFAVDSVPAVLAITTDTFIVYTSNIWAILGLRALYFLLASFLKDFKYLHYGLAIILIAVSFKMLTSGIIHLPSWLILALVLVVLSTTFLLEKRTIKR